MTWQKLFKQNIVFNHPWLRTSLVDAELVMLWRILPLTNYVRREAEAFIGAISKECSTIREVWSVEGLIIQL